MSEPTSFHSAALADGPRNRRIAVLVVVLVVGFIGVAIAKPWGGAIDPASPTPRPSSGPAVALPSASPIVTEAPTTTTRTPFGPLPAAFITPIPPPTTAAWTGIRWRQLAPDDPLNLVRSVLRWRGGFVATGGYTPGNVSIRPVWTSVWTSTDGAHWEPLSFDTGTTFWPGLNILGVVEVSDGLVALTELGDTSHCNAGSGCLPVVPWTSPDGRAWSPRTLPHLGPPEASGTAPLLAAGPAGLVAVSTGAPAYGATAPDGVEWTSLPVDTFPRDFVINDLRGTAAGYVAGGLSVASDTRWDAATLWSADGHAWTPMEPLPLAVDSGVTLAPTGSPSTVVVSIVAGRGGMIAIGRVVETPGAALWWQSSDGRAWRPLPTYAPLGPTACPGPGCGGQANGVLIGDGERMVALRGWPDARAWTSSDGRTWQTLDVTGDLPTDQATQATILPGGVLLSDGSTMWFGEAVTSASLSTQSPPSSPTSVYTTAAAVASFDASTGSWPE